MSDGSAAAGPPVIRRIGFFTFGPVRGPTRNFQAFVEDLRRLGWEDREGPGQTVAITYRAEDPAVASFAAIAAELVALPADVIVASGGHAIYAARDATRTVPIVVTVDDGDPVGTGLVASLDRPGGNITGLTRYVPNLSVERLEVLAGIVPAATRVGVLGNPTVPDIELEWTRIDVAARQRGWMSVPLAARTAADLPAAFEAARAARIEALLVLGDPIMYAHRRRVVQLAAENAVPALYPSRDYVQVGGLASYGPRLIELYVRAATYVDKILRGAKAADLPMETPPRYELVVNESAAEALGIGLAAPWAGRIDETIRE